MKVKWIRGGHNFSFKRPDVWFGIGKRGSGKRIGRSSRTPVLHIHQHNDAVERSGFCPLCRRFGSPHSEEIAVRGMVKS